MYSNIFISILQYILTAFRKTQVKHLSAKFGQKFLPCQVLYVLRYCYLPNIK